MPFFSSFLGPIIVRSGAPAIISILSAFLRNSTPVNGKLLRPLAPAAATAVSACATILIMLLLLLDYDLTRMDKYIFALGILISLIIFFAGLIRWHKAANEIVDLLTFKSAKPKNIFLGIIAEKARISNIAMKKGWKLYLVATLIAMAQQYYFSGSL